MTVLGSYVLDSEWYWRIFEGGARFDDAPGATAARDFLHPLARIARDHVAIDHIVVDPDGDGVSFRVAERPVAIRCRGLRVVHLLAALNSCLRAANTRLAFTVIESRRYELQGVLHPIDAAPRRGFAQGTIPP